MNDYIISVDENGSPYLQHYGVLGMKWGVRHDPQRAYTKSKKKAEKLVKKSDKALARAGKHNSVSKSRFMSERNRAKHLKKAHYAKLTTIKASKKASKWISRMEKEFSKQDVVSMDPELIKTGKKMLERYNTTRAFY